jgi:hypothetical protein
MCLRKIKVVSRDCSKPLERLSFNVGLCISIHENRSYHDQSDTLSVFFMEYSKQDHSEPTLQWEEKGKILGSQKKLE